MGLRWTGGFKKHIDEAKKMRVSCDGEVENGIARLEADCLICKTREEMMIWGELGS